MPRARRLMGIAAGSGKIGFAYLIDGELMDWRLSIEASRSALAAGERVDEWLRFYRPDRLVIENPDETRKGAHSKELQMAVAAVATTLSVPVTLQPPAKGWPNKYAEAAYLAQEFPQIAAWLPDKRRHWETEPRNIILFEALSLAWSWWQARTVSRDDIAF